MYETTPEMFEILCKMVLARRLNTDSLHVTAFRQDEGIDIEGYIDEDVFTALFGAQVKRYTEGNTVGNNHVQRFSGALTQANYQTGTYITSSSFTAPAVEAAKDLQIHLVDGERLAMTMVQHRIGVNEIRDGYEVDGEFWEALKEPEQQDTVPSTEVPLANSFETLRLFLKAIEKTDGSKRAIHGEVSDFDPRHADLYGTAGWLLGFVHKDTPKSVDGRDVRRWGLTSDGVKYLRLHERGDTEAAESLLVDAVREVEIIRRMYELIEREGELTYDALKEKLSVETTLAETSVSRRASTVAQWLTVLPDVEAVSDGHSKKFVQI
ncbi:restriction endonuclease [Haloarcula sp. S1CR25-12]|uniref:Restriction endonuclease n=1 Tax=Haloarcula saliterrae TaxID=2950534 RepID=A0ABU2FE01_9EURY|nr:restriction endonuclease [Haloarcula sp. S1CR25-12]MDS0260041.1 restriction endonuclease [Haloarcula sp. S1CR25-12]